MTERQAYPELTDRQRAIFGTLLEGYVLSAQPISSKQLAQLLDLNLSPASIRSVMADLEDMGLLQRPHASAGGAPTDFGYGYYVDHMMGSVSLTPAERKAINRAVEAAQIHGIGKALESTSVALSRLSAMISVVLAPRMDKTALHKIDVSRLAGAKLMVVLTMKDSQVQSMLLSIPQETSDDTIQRFSDFVNQRLSGLKLSEISGSMEQRLQGAPEELRGLIKRFASVAHTLLKSDHVEAVHFGETRHLLNLPEFSDLKRMREVFDVLENRREIPHLLERGSHTAQRVRIAIGRELEEEGLYGCSLVSTMYRVGEAEGSLGVIGPTRMDYARVSAVVTFAADAIRKRLVE